MLRMLLAAALLAVPMSAVHAASSAMMRCDGDAECIKGVRRLKLAEDDPAKVAAAKRAERRAFIRDNTNVYVNTYTRRRGGRSVTVTCTTTAAFGNSDTVCE